MPLERRVQEEGSKEALTAALFRLEHASLQRPNSCQLNAVILGLMPRMTVTRWSVDGARFARPVDVEGREHDHGQHDEARKSAGYEVTDRIELWWRVGGSPEPAEAFVTRRFGPFLVIRTTAPTGDARQFIRRTVQVQRTGRLLELGDPDVNLQTAERALRLLSDR